MYICPHFAVLIKRGSKNSKLYDMKNEKKKAKGEFKASQKLFSVCVYALFGWNRFSYAFKRIYCN